MSMTSSRPYLVKALYEWILDNNCTPHILVFGDAEGVDVPLEHVQNGQIVLNISPSAVVGFLMNNEAISFNARFSGRPTDIYVPMHAIMGIVTRENGKGMMFDFMEPTPPDNEGEELTDHKNKKNSSTKKANGKPTLRVVK